MVRPLRTLGPNRHHLARHAGRPDVCVDCYEQMPSGELDVWDGSKACWALRARRRAITLEVDVE